MMTFQQRVNAVGITRQELSAQLGVKPDTVKLMLSKNNPSAKARELVDGLLEKRLRQQAAVSYQTVLQSDEDDDLGVWAKGRRGLDRHGFIPGETVTVSIVRHVETGGAGQSGGLKGVLSRIHESLKKVREAAETDESLGQERQLILDHLFEGLDEIQLAINVAPEVAS